MKEYLAALVEDQQMNGPVFEPSPVDLAPGLLANDPVPIVHHIKYLFAHVASSLENP